MNRPNAIADQRETEEFLNLLAQICRRINHRVDMCHRTGATFDGDGLIEHPWGYRRLARLSEQDRKIVEELTDHLQQRFRAAGT